MPSIWPEAAESTRRQAKAKHSQHRGEIMRNIVLFVLASLGLVVFFVGAALPLRLSPSERDANRELVATVVGFGLVAPLLFLKRKNKE
jgi:hypothetical protein